MNQSKSYSRRLFQIGFLSLNKTNILRARIKGKLLKMQGWNKFVTKIFGSPYHTPQSLCDSSPSLSPW